MDSLTTKTSIRLRYRIEGDGPKLVLLHGVGGRLEVWDGVVQHLRDHFQIMRCDLRGHGQSEKPAGPYSIEDFANDTRELLDETGFELCDLAGFSLGGLIAQQIALIDADRLRSIALLSTVAGRTPEEQARVMERLEILASGIPGTHFERSVARWFTDAFREANPQIIADYAARNQQNDPQAYAAAYRVLATTDLADRLHEIRKPTLIATGENDIGSNVRMAQHMHSLIADSRLHIFPELRHSILIEAPDQVAALLHGFFSTQ